MMKMAHATSHASDHGHGEAHAHGSAHDASPAHAGHHAPADSAPCDDGTPAKGHGQGLCCGVMCVTALPAAFADIAAPPPPTAHRVAEGARDASDNTPARLDRPPRT